MDRPLKIGIDVDDVLNNLLECWINEWNIMSGQNVKASNCTNWDLHKLIPDEKDYSQFSKIPACPEFYNELKPIPLAQTVLQELIACGVEIYILTGTYTSQHVLKENWLKKHYPFIPENHIIYAPTGTKHLFNMDIIIEDSPINIFDYQCQVLLLDKMYNRDINSLNTANIRRVSDWENIREIFVRKYNILPEKNESKIEQNDSLINKLLECKTADDFSELLNPFITKTYDLGYTTALGDVADKIKNMFPDKQE